MKQNVFFVSGIDTNIGKSYATAYLAHLWNRHPCLFQRLSLIHI